MGAPIPPAAFLPAPTNPAHVFHLGLRLRLAGEGGTASHQRSGRRRRHGTKKRQRDNTSRRKSCRLHFRTSSWHERTHRPAL
ncbi:hypothetical protein Xaut_3885 [Xanthobacter versatilis]|uniref:Uncharacterized protein n=1 Tax=Xanthobacter autotrophicus (strain ATCC BAA-1158 / Py2) TaxID=78245 RepID=A7IM66_XANP2|nr:hypothetical protein Xaut_3885 [Xanthobacter autotrophicus Py2]